MPFVRFETLYVANASAGVTVYPPHVTVYVAAGGAVRHFAQGIKDPVSALYLGGYKIAVANQGNSTVTVYASNDPTPMRTISTGIVRPVALAFDP
jgi:hypothetical protein